MNPTRDIEATADALEQKCRDTKYELLCYPVCETIEKYHQMLCREAAKSPYAGLDIEAEAFLGEAFQVYSSLEIRKRRPLLKYLRSKKLIRTRFLGVIEDQRDFIDVLGGNLAKKLLFALMVFGEDSYHHDIAYRLAYMFYRLIDGDHDAGRIYDEFYRLSRWPLLKNYFPPDENELCKYRG